MMGEGGAIQMSKMSLLYDKIKPQTHKKKVTNLNALSFGSPTSTNGLGLNFPGGTA